VIIPALHIDQEGNRLGQGGGSYDRALAQLKAENVWKIALIHHGELTSDALPHEPHDQKVDAAATPNLVVRFK
jgi:5-formyltetrahydrofolate cyclo-ligase